MLPMRGRAFIIDNRDGTLERVSGLALNCYTAENDAFHSAQVECAERNEREGWSRFVPVLGKTARALGLVPRCIVMAPPIQEIA